MVVMMMVMVMVTARRYHDPGDVTAIGVMVVMMVMVITADADNDLGQLDIRVRRLGRRRFIDGLQQFGRVRDRFEQVGEGIRPHHVCRGRSRRSLSGVHRPERRYRSQKSSYLLIHRISSNEQLPVTATRPTRDGSAIVFAPAA
jgi:hypothetical protein